MIILRVYIYICTKFIEQPNMANLTSPQSKHCQAYIYFALRDNKYTYIYIYTDPLINFMKLYS